MKYFQSASSKSVVKVAFKDSSGRKLNFCFPDSAKVKVSIVFFLLMIENVVFVHNDVYLGSVSICVLRRSPYPIFAEHIYSTQSVTTPTKWK